MTGDYDKSYNEFMKEDFLELIEYLDGKFRKIEDQLDTKSDKADVNLLTNAVDAYAYKADGYLQELTMVIHKADRLEKWVKQIAEKIGMRLE